jgi:hypothetical protein
MVAGTLTMYCRSCQELRDILVGYHRDHFLSEDLIQEDEHKSILGLCLVCKGRDMSPWTTGEPCPRCGGVMVRGSTVTLWD